MAETILIVDDEDTVRKTFHEWLQGAGLDAEILSAGDAETALGVANQRMIDLAVLDWNLGAGNDGLQLLEDLYLFNPDVVAIMITGYAHQATPLDAMRMGVRDYLDKNQELNRDAFLAAIRKQLDKLRPAKRERFLSRSLSEFKDSLEKVLPLVRTATAMNDPVPFTESIRHLFQFLLRTTRASDGALIVRSYDPNRQPAEICRAYNVQGEALEVPLAPFPQSLAGMVLSMQEACAMARLDQPGALRGAKLQPFEQNRKHVLAAPLPVSPAINVVLELFDKQGAGDGAFSDDDRRLVGAAAEFGAEMIKQALSERHAQSMLLDAVGAALTASQSISDTIRGTAQQPDQPPPVPVMQQLQTSLEKSSLGVVDADQALKLAELLRVITLRHGREATEYCIKMLEGVARLLGAVTGTEEMRP